MKRFGFIFFFGFLALLNSCTQEKPNPIVGKWIAESDNQTDPDRYLIISQNEIENSFSQKGWYGQEIKGSWEHKDGILSLTFVAPESYQIDSIQIENQPSGLSEATYFEGETEVAKETEGVIYSTQTTKELKVLSLNENNLALKDGNERYDYGREVKVAGGITFMSVLRGTLGMLFLLALTYVFSSNKKRIDWSLVLKGTALQIIIAFLVLKVPLVEAGFNWLSGLFVEVISYTNSGVDFLFGQMGIGVVQAPLITFAVKVLPTIIFFSALMSMFYYLGIVQKVVYVFAWIMKKFMRMSGAESLAAAGNVFLGQTESPLLVKPYLMGMTKSEMMCLMTGGMATIAGGVLAAYVFFLGGDDPVEQAFFAKHLLTASIISAPAAVVAAKILVPETEEISKDIDVPKEKIGTNLLEAIANGTSDGLKLAVNVGAMLLVFIALMAMGNGILHWIGDATNLNDTIAATTPYKEGLSFQFLLGYIGAPIVWMIGVDSTDMVLVGELLGQKTILNEFIAYPRLGELKAAGAINEKSVIISTYMLCGFANFASIGIQIGGIGSLVPSRKGLLSQLGMKALLGGTIASLMTAAIVGMMY
ncbi:MAG: nucleoside transporter C-terminal domain-containing protein [Crocinitomicaceae bacterium]